MRAVHRLGKRIVLDLEGDLHLVLHLMVAGPPALEGSGRGGAGQDRPRCVRLPRRDAPAHRGLDQEARVAARGARGRGARARSIPGASSRSARRCEAFAEALRRESHTVKRSLTDPHLFSGIGNAYSDEILWRAKLSPVRLTRAMTARGDRAAARGDAGHAARVDRAARARDGRRVSREGHRVPRRDGRPRPLPQAVPGVRLAGAAHRVRGQREQLLREVPDRGQAAGRPLAVAADEGRLAQDGGGARGEAKGRARPRHRAY